MSFLFILKKKKENRERVVSTIASFLPSAASNKKTNFIVFHLIDFHVRCFPIDCDNGKFPLGFLFVMEKDIFWHNKSPSRAVKSLNIFLWWRL